MGLLSIFSRSNVLTINEQLKVKRNKAIFFSILFSIVVIGIIVIFAIAYNYRTNKYFDEISEARITNSGNQCKDNVTSAIEDCFQDAYYLKDNVKDEYITTSGVLDNTKLNNILNNYKEYYRADKVGVIVDNIARFGTDDTIWYASGEITEKYIGYDSTSLYFIIPVESNIISGVIAKISKESFNALIVPSVYNGQASVIVCAPNGDNVMVGDLDHLDRIEGNCFEDVGKYYPEEDAKTFERLYRLKGIQVAHFNINPHVMAYMNELDYGDSTGNFKILFFCPRSVLTDQLNRLNNVAVQALYSTLIVATIMLITLYLLIVRTNHNNLKNNSYDDKTGLLIEKNFYHDAQALLLRDNSDYGIVHMNIRSFSKINQFYGTNTADEILTHIGSILKNNIKDENGDITGYQNGDNFLLLLKGDNDDIILKINTLNKIIKDYSFPENINITTSYGIKIPDRKSINIPYEVECAKFAEKKLNETDLIYFYDIDTIKKQQEAEALISRFDEALEKHEFEVHVQLKWDLGKNNWGGAEALVRWRDISGLIPPGKFVPLFEENGFITKLDKYVFEETCKMLSIMLDNGENCVPISVNLSKRHFANEFFFKDFEDIIAKYKIPHELIQFEITEGLFVDNVSTYQNFIDTVHKQGFSIAMDDFGTGYSSLNLIHELDFDVIKLDSKFFRGKFDDETKVVVSTIVSLCHMLNKKVVAEGIEESHEVEFLKSINCDYIQGYYYSRPLPFEDAKKLYYN